MYSVCYSRHHAPPVVVSVDPIVGCEPLFVIFFFVLCNFYRNLKEGSAARSTQR